MAGEIKVVGLLKRRPGMTVEAFRAYYETHHRRIGEKYLDGVASRYRRRYLTSRADRQGNAPADPDFDVILEIWYASEEDFQASNQQLSMPEAVREIVEDEEKLFDRPCNRFFLIDAECESALQARH